MSELHQSLGPTRSGTARKHPPAIGSCVPRLGPAERMPDSRRASHAGPRAHLGLILGLYRSSFISSPYFRLKNRHQIASHETNQFGSDRYLEGREFLFGSGQARP